MWGGGGKECWNGCLENVALNLDKICLCLETSSFLNTEMKMFSCVNLIHCDIAMSCISKLVSLQIGQLIYFGSA